MTEVEDEAAVNFNNFLRHNIKLQRKTFLQYVKFVCTLECLPWPPHLFYKHVTTREL